MMTEAQDFFVQSGNLDRARRYKRHLERSVLAAEIEDAKHASDELRREHARNAQLQHQGGRAV